jgi:hypothetical protein
VAAAPFDVKPPVLVHRKQYSWPAVNVLAVNVHVTVFPDTVGVKVACGQLLAPDGQ